MLTMSKRRQRGLEGMIPALAIACRGTGGTEEVLYAAMPHESCLR